MSDQTIIYKDAQSAENKAKGNPCAQVKTVETTCPYCGVGCGIQAEVSNAKLREVNVKGSLIHPANFGRLCSKGSALGETLNNDARLLAPQIEGKTVSWDEAAQTVANKFQQIIKEHGPDAVAFYVSGQILTEDYYVANKLMKGFIGSANIETNSRLCMSSAVAAHKRAFGEDAVPGCYEDLELADLVILTGSNTAWCHPILFQRIKQAKANNPDMKVVVIDPRKTATCDIADLHLPIKSGTDVTLFNGLLRYLVEEQYVDLPSLSKQIKGAQATIESAFNCAATNQKVAEITELSPSDIELFYQWFADTPKTVSAFSQGVNQSSSGTDKANAIINCHLATGKIGLPGSTTLSLTGQPNAMGGREVGGLSNQLAAHMDFTEEDLDRVSRFWQTDSLARKPGLKTIDMFDAIAEGKIKAVWVMATNPAVSLPNADKVRESLRNCDFVVVSDSVKATDTTECANVLLPAQDWGEKDGTVTNSERRISRQRRLVEPRGEAKPDWWIISTVAEAMGFGEHFDYTHASQIFDEHARLSAFENNPEGKERWFNLSGLTGLSQEDYDNLLPIQWPVSEQTTEEHTTQGQARLFTPTNGNHKTRLTMVPVSFKAPVNSPNAEFPLILNTGRIRDQWHTMTRTALASRLNQHKPEPFVEVHPDDAANANLTQGELAQIKTHLGSMLARVDITTQQRPGSLFIPMHWSDQFAAQGRLGALVNPATDPISGQPEIKHTPANIRPYKLAWQGFILSRRKLSALKLPYWVNIPLEGGHHTLIGGTQTVADWTKEARGWLCSTTEENPDWLEYEDKHLGAYRAARLVDGQLDAVIFISPNGPNIDTQWLSSLLTQPESSKQERQAILSGKSPAGIVSCGKTVCACFNVGENTIKDAVKTQGLTTVEQVGKCLGAGTNCGSCIPEIKEFLPG